MNGGVSQSGPIKITSTFGCTRRRVAKSQPLARKAAAFAACYFAWFLLIGGGCGKANREIGVQLVLSTEQPTAGTTFELRFDEPMAPENRPGAQAEVSPLVISPKIGGHFVWTSQRSGVFTPDEPLALATDYELTLRPGLTRPDGQMTSAKLRRVIHTPPFGVSQVVWQANTNIKSEPEIRLSFNADTRAKDIAARARFINGDGKQVPAVAEQGTIEDGWMWGTPALTWAAVFDRQRQTNSAPTRLGRPEEDPTNPVPNLVIVTPAEPLTAARNWRLVIDSGLPSADGRLQTYEKYQCQVGDVQQFTLSEIEMHHVVNRRPWLELQFSKLPNASLTNSFADWVKVSPQPEGLSARVSGYNSLLLEGDWQRQIKYQVIVARGLPAAEAFTLSKTSVFTNEVPPVPSRLYFPEFSTEQFSSGNRVFPLMVVNARRVLVKAKQLDAPTAIHALRGFKSYLDGQDNGTSEGYHRLDYNLIPGRTILSEEMDGTPEEDVSAEIKLSWDKILKGKKSGIVFIQAERAVAEPGNERALGTQALVQLTDLGLTWKSGGGRLWAFVFSYSTGQPVTNAQVRLYSDENELLAEGVTGSTGEAEVPLPKQAAWLAAQVDEDLHAVNLQAGVIPTWQLGIPWNSAEEEEPAGRRVALFTDRSVYRPNETVNMKAVIRDLDDGRLSIPAGRTGLVECADSRGNHFFTTNFTLSDLGSCAAAIPLPAEPRGGYEVILSLDNHTYPRQIQVADFQPAAFEIDFEPKPAIGPEEKVELPVSACYLFGKPLTRAKVRWWVETADTSFRPNGFDDFAFERSWLEARWGRRPGNYATSGEGRIEGGSNCLVRLDVPLNSQAPQPRSGSLLVEVTDLNDQTLTRSASFVKHSSDFYLGLKRFERVLEPGSPLPVEIAAVGSDSKPWREPVAAHLTLQRIEWNSIQVQGVGRTVRYRSEPVVTKVLEKDVTISAPTRSAEDAKAYRGTVIGDVVAPGGGQYLLEVSARDAAGHEMSSSLEMSVAEKAELAWDYQNGIELKLTADKTSYEPGQTALLLVKAPFSGEAWVTIEREKVLRSFRTKLEGNAPSIRVPIEAADAPNIFVSVVLARGAADSTRQFHQPEYRIGYCQLLIDDPASRLKVQTVADKTNCLPGDIVTVETTVTDFADKPAPNTEITLYAVDEGVLSLMDYDAPDLHGTLLAPRALRVAAGSSLPFLMSEDPGQLTFQNKGYLGGGGGREHLRRRFLPCAFWNASLMTDADGHVRASFPAPDSLTRYRIFAIAHNARNQFGTGKSSFSVSKPLTVEPSLAQSAAITDRIIARAVVHNQTDTAGSVLVTLQLDDKARAEGQLTIGPAATTSTNALSAPPVGTTISQTVSVGAHGSVVVQFPLVLSATGPAQWVWRARFSSGEPSYTDAVQSSLSVGEVTPLLREAVTLRVDSQTNLMAALNPQLLAGSGTISVTVANTKMVYLREAIQQLLHYPYGCVEQTSSSLLPWLVLSDTPGLLAFTQRDSAQAAAAARAGVARLFSMQTSSGGLSYWPGGSEPMFWGSAYGAFVLQTARKAGVAVPEKQFTALLNYLSGQLRDSSSRADSYAQCLALYVLALAGRAEPAYHTRFYEKRDQLTQEERSLLALAMAIGEQTGSAPSTNSGTKGLATANLAAQLIQELLEPKSASSTKVSDPFGCSAREKAVQLLAWAALPSGEAKSARLFAEMQSEQKHGHWYTTQGNAWALLAMRDYLRRTETGGEAQSGSLGWVGNQKTFELAPGCGVFTGSYRFDSSAGEKPLLLASPSGKTFYVQVAIESRLANPITARQDHGMGLQRRYERLNDDNKPESFDHLRVGDRVLVTLNVTVPESAQYVAVDDPLPGVFEALNSEFKTQQVAGKVQRSVTHELGYWNSYREIRADRVLFFGDNVPAGKYVIQYVARVRAAGRVTAPSARVEEMYDPDRFGLTEAQALVSEALE
jgi:alpha-2-macroglobulin